MVNVCCRLYSSDGHALIDLMMRPGEEPPEVGKRVLCRHPFEESKRAYVMPHKVEPLYKVSQTGQTLLQSPQSLSILTRLSGRTASRLPTCPAWTR